MSLIAIIRKNFIESGLISDEILMEGITLASFLPGPVAVNVVAYIGYYLAGITGAIISLIAVLLPSFLGVCLLSAIYFQSGIVIHLGGVMQGVIAGIIGIILSVGTDMAKKNCLTWKEVTIMLFALLVPFYIKGHWPLLIILLLSGVVGILFLRSDKNAVERDNPKGRNNIYILWLVGIFLGSFVLVKVFFNNSIIFQLYTEFSSVSLTLFGGGYVMIPILKGILVEHLKWVNSQEFTFGISIGQVTPGPILISAAFFGYKLKGFVGALVATIGIFLPSSLLMLTISAHFKKIKNTRVIKRFLAGVRPAVVGLIIFSGMSFYIEHIQLDGFLLTTILTLLSYFVSLIMRVNSAYVIITCGILGYLTNHFL